jgi:hypothetical protein
MLADFACRLLSADSCAELLQFPGFGAPAGAWDMPDFMMGDPVPTVPYVNGVGGYA